MAPGYIYLLRPLSSINNNENVYKIGKTHRHNLKRFCEYPTGSILLLHSSCMDCDAMEKSLLKMFDANFIIARKYGREYFEGGLLAMKRIINDEITNEVEPDDVVENECNISNTIIYNDVTNDDVCNDIKRNNYKKMHCATCNYTCYQKCDWLKHISTKKHFRFNEDDKTDITNNIFKCKCGKEYKHHCSLCKHRKKCTFKVEENPQLSNEDTTNIMIKLLNQNSEMQKQLIKIYSRI